MRPIQNLNTKSFLTLVYLSYFFSSSENKNVAFIGGRTKKEVKRVDLSCRKVGRMSTFNNFIRLTIEN